MSRIPKLQENLSNEYVQSLNSTENLLGNIQGKTIKSHTLGFVKFSDDIHESHVLILEFTDGSKLYIQTACNADNIISDVISGRTDFKTSDFHSDLFFTWET